VPDNSGGNEPLTAAWRDAVALSAALPAAPILTLTAETMPAIAEALADWQVAPVAVAPRDALCASERRLVRELCVAAGAAKLLWAGLRLAVLHLVVPGTAAAVTEATAAEEDPWHLAQAFWYPL
jgi:hypothetical protein